MILPKSLHEMAKADRWTGIRKALSEITIEPVVRQCEILYIQPIANGEECIDFETFADIVAEHQDPISRRFAESLRHWARFPV